MYLDDREDLNRDAKCWEIETDDARMEIHEVKTHRATASPGESFQRPVIPFIEPPMEPRPFDRGNTSSGMVGPMTISALQWSHGLSTVETWPKPTLRTPAMPCFNGATAFRPWKRPRDRGTGAGLGCFNGATAFRPWKLAGTDADAAMVIHASMEPRPFDRGNQFVMDAVRRRLIKLQWSHGLSTVETPG